MSEADSRELRQALSRVASGQEKSRRTVAEMFRTADASIAGETLVEACKASDSRLRRAAWEIVGESGVSGFDEHLLDGLTDSQQNVVQMAVWAAGKLRSRQSVPQLLSLVEKGVGFKVAKTVVWALGEIGDGSAVPALCHLASSGSARLLEGVFACANKLGRTAVLEVLGAMDWRSEAACNALLESSKSSQSLRASVLRAIAQETDRSSLQLLLEPVRCMTLHARDVSQLLGDARENVRASALASLAHAYVSDSERLALLTTGAKDASNVVVRKTIRAAATWIEDARVRAIIEDLCSLHPSPSVRADASNLLAARARTEELRAIARDNGVFALETLPGLERFVSWEARDRDIALEVITEGNGWLIVRVEDSVSGHREGFEPADASGAGALSGVRERRDLPPLQALSRLHTVRRMIGLVQLEAVSVSQPPLGSMQVTNLRLTTVHHAEDLLPGVIEELMVGDNLLQGITVIREKDMLRPRRRRNATSLDWRVARAMTLLSRSRAGDIVLDPMCGTGTLLMDRAEWAPYERLIGGEIEPTSLDIAQINLRPYQDAVVQRGDARELSLEDQTVDTIVCNLPFGRRVGDHETNVTLYPDLIREWERVLREDGVIVLLTQEVSLLYDALQRTRAQFGVESDESIHMGGLIPHLLVLRKLRTT